MAQDAFVAIDVETANTALASICAVGVVRFEGGMEVSATKQLIDPCAPFRPINIAIHGIEPSMVRGAPRFSDYCGKLADLMANQVVVSHIAFDRAALERAFGLANKKLPVCEWIDTVQVARRAWPERKSEGYSLPKLAEYFNLSLKHHDPLEDARTCGRLLLLATGQADHEVAYWQTVVEQPLSNFGHPQHSPGGIWPEKVRKRRGAPEGPLHGEVIVITGTLSRPRSEIADMLAAAGADVCPSVTKKTTMLIVGAQDLERLAGKDMSSKQVKAEEMIAAGRLIRIVCETDVGCLAA